MEESDFYESRDEKAKKNFSSDKHFQKHLNMLNASEKFKNIPLKQSISENKAEIFQSQNKSRNPLKPQSLISIEPPIIQHQISYKAFDSNLLQNQKSEANKTIENNADFFDMLAEYDKKQKDLLTSYRNNIPSNTYKQEDFNQNLVVSLKDLPQNDFTYNTNQPKQPYKTNEILSQPMTMTIKPIDTVINIEKDPLYLQGVIAEKEHEKQRVMNENAALVNIKLTLENALIAQNDLIQDMKRNLLISSSMVAESKRAPTMINANTKRKIVRQTCPNSPPNEEHFLTWNSNGKTHTNCSKCGAFKSCRWICRFCEDNFCIACVPDCIFDGKCYLDHVLKEEILGLNRECDHCGNTYENSIYWIDNECALDLCKSCYEDLEKTSTGNYIVESNEDYKAFFKIEYNDIMLKKFDRKREKKNMNSIESNSYMFLTVILMMFVPFLFLFIEKIFKLVIPFDLSFWRRRSEADIPEEERKLLRIEEKGCVSYYKSNYSLDNLLFILKLLMVLLCFTLLIAPSCLVIVIQVWILSEFHSYNELDGDIAFNNFFILKYLIIWIFILMICQEASKTINAIYFIVSKFVIEDLLKFITLLIVITPLVAFLLICWYLCYFNMITIIDDNDIIDVIQNFAGFFILLEFGRIILQFLKSIHFNDFFIWIRSVDLINISLNIGNSNFRVEKTLSSIMDNDEFFMEEIYDDLKNKSIWFQSLKIFIINVGIIVINVCFYIYLKPMMPI